MKIITITFLAVLFISAPSCKKNTEFKTTTVEGIIRKQGASTYMYGTHILQDENGKLRYALSSEKINLDKYDGESVKVKGHLVKDYPVIGGPEYLVVTRVK